MASVTWDPEQYQRFSDDRARPFFDLLARVRTERPRRVLDLGCGPGNLTAVLADRWPSAEIIGIDSSTEMIRSCPTGDRLSFRVSDIESERVGDDVDVLVSNAALHWVPAHRELLTQWAHALPSGATMAWQVPGNFRAPSHRLLYELVASARWRSRFPGLAGLTSPVGTAADYAELLLTAGWSADAWETTYVHLLQGDDAVLNWVRGTTLGPVRRVLTGDEFADFEQEYATMLRSAYPPGRFGTSYPFRRIFAVGRKP